MHGHGNKICWKLHPKLHPKKDKEVMQTNARSTIGGNEETGIIPKETFKVDYMTKRTHKSSRGKDLVDCLHIFFLCKLQKLVVVITCFEYFCKVNKNNHYVQQVCFSLTCYVLACL